VARRHPEADHEADGLRQWAGDGTVELFAVEETADTVALLLERCRPGTALRVRPEPEQDTVIAGALLGLWREPRPGHRFRPLQAMCDMWADAWEGQRAAGLRGLDDGLDRTAVGLLRELPATAERNVLLCTDLHAGNVLAARRRPWLVIDPKPYVGDPAYDVVQHLLNCGERLRTEPRDLVRRMADLAGVDGDRVLLWLFARCVQEAPRWPGLAEVVPLITPA
jgi:streptomycin 6-kinase